MVDLKRQEFIRKQATVTKDKQNQEEQRRRASLLWWVHTEKFGLLSAALIFANAAYIGIQTDYQVKESLDKASGRVSMDQPHWVIGDVTFCALFFFELILRMFAQRQGYITGFERHWNLFDVIVVSASVFEVVTDAAGLQLHMGISVLRTLRVVRILRVLRSANNIAVLRNLKTMLYALADPGCSSSFCSAIILLTAVMYIFSLLFMQAVKGYLDDHPGTSLIGKMDMYYGSLDKTFWTLICSVTGGYDWAYTADPIARIGGGYVFAFLLYISFVLLGLLNILNGIFVNAALQASLMNRELATDCVISKRETMIEDMVALFIEADVDKSNTVSWEEFKYYIQDEKIKAYFMALELDMNSVVKIFELLDTAYTGELDLLQFVEGCIQLRGNAKMVDMTIMKRDYHAMLDEIVDKLDDLSTEVEKIANPMMSLQGCIDDSMRNTPPAPMNA